VPPAIERRQTEEPVGRDRRIAIQPKVSADVWLRFKALCHARKVVAEQALEVLLIQALEEAGLRRK